MSSFFCTLFTGYQHIPIDDLVTSGIYCITHANACESRERSVRRKTDDWIDMELHAFEEMAQSLDAALLQRKNDDDQPTSVFPPVTPPGMAYVPYQQWGEIYHSEEGFRNGTMFPVLDKPFAPQQPMGGECAK